MNQKRLMSLMAVFAGLLLSSATPTYAQDVPEEFENIERVIVHDKSNSKGELEADKSAENDATSTSSETSELNGSDTNKEDIAEEESVVLAKPLFETTHPGAFYSAYTVSPYNGMVELCGRSLWSISPGYTIHDWYANDTITLSPSGLFAYPYCLTNQRTSQYVCAKLYMGPDIYSPFRYRVASNYIDHNGMVRVGLVDGNGQQSTWYMASHDYNKISWWKIGHTIMIGLNTVQSNEGSNILINIKTGNHASGNCIGY